MQQVMNKFPMYICTISEGYNYDNYYMDMLNASNMCSFSVV